MAPIIGFNDKAMAGQYIALYMYENTINVSNIFKEKWDTRSSPFTMLVFFYMIFITEGKAFTT